MMSGPRLEIAPADLDDVLGYVQRVRSGQGDDLDAELDRLLSEGREDRPGGGPTDGPA